MFNVPANAKDWLHIADVIGPNASPEMILLRKSPPPGVPAGALAEIDRCLRERLIELRHNVPPGCPAAVLLEIDALLTEEEVLLSPRASTKALEAFLMETRELLNILKSKPGEQTC